MPLHFAAQHRVRLPVLRLLLERGPGVVNQVGGAGRTPLAVAADAKFAEGVSLLLERGADPTIKDMAGLSALERATNAKIKALLKKVERAGELVRGGSSTRRAEGSGAQ